MTKTATASPVDEVPAADFDTIADLPFHAAGRFQNPRLIGRCGPEGIEAISSKVFLERVRDLSLGLAALGVAPGDRVAIVSESRPDWVMADLAILTGGAVTVPIYPTLSPVQVHYVLQDSGAKAAIVSTREQLAKIQEVRHKLPALEAVILMDGWTPVTARRSSRSPPSPIAATPGWRASGAPAASSASGRARCGPTSSRPSSTRPGRRASPRA